MPRIAALRQHLSGRSPCPVTSGYIMIKEALIAGAVGGLLWLERFQAFQLLIARPIVGAALVGAILGDLSAGLASGVLFELLWLRRPPVGGFIPPDVTLASVVTAAVASGLRSDTSLNLTSTVFFCFVVLLPVCFAGRTLDERLRLGLGKLSGFAAAAQAEGKDKGSWPYFATALGFGFLTAFIFITPVVFLATYVLRHVVTSIPTAVERAFSFGYFVVPLVGIADLLVGLDEKENLILFVIGFLAAIGGSLIVRL